MVAGTITLRFPGYNNGARLPRAFRLPRVCAA